MSPLRNIKLLAFFNFFCDFRLYGPILILYFVEVSGSYTLAASVFSITMVTSAFFEIPTAVLSDRVGRRLTAVIGSIVSVIAVLLYAVAPWYSLLLLGAALEGVARAFLSGSNDALLYESLASNNRQSEFHRHAGRVAAMFQLALGLSAALGGFVGMWSLRGTVVLSIVPQVICVAIAWRFVEPSLQRPREAGSIKHFRTAICQVRQNPLLRRLVWASSLRFGAGEAAFQLLPAFVNALWPMWAVGVARTTSNGAAFLGFAVSGRLLDRFGTSRILVWSHSWQNAAGFVALLHPTIASPAILASQSLAYGPGAVAQNSLLQEEFSDGERASMGSVVTSCGSIAFAVLSVLAGVVADRWGATTTLLFCQVVGLAALPLYWSVHRHKLRTHPQRPN